MNATFRHAIAAILPTIASPAWAEQPQADFETGTDGWQSSQGGSISIDGTHYKSGAHALLWTWTRPGSALVYTFPAQKTARHKNTATHLGLWLYNETPKQERLHLSLYKGETLIASCWYNLRYTGWRVLGLNTATLDLPPGTEYDKAIFRTDSPSGTVWIDAVKPAFLSAPVQTDDQQPWAGTPALLQETPDKTCYSQHDISLNRAYLPPFVPAKRISPKAREDMKNLDRHYLGKPGSGGISYADFTSLTKTFDTLGIKERNGIVTGPPLALSDNGFHTIPGSIDFNLTYVPLLRQLSTAIHKEQEENRTRAENMYILLCRHLLDQGHQEGSGNFGWIGNGYDYRYYTPALYAHRELLARAGILDGIAKNAAWLNMGHSMMSNSPFSSCDQFYNYSSHLPGAILMIPDEAERYQRLRAYKQYLDRTIGQNPLPFGRDGTAHHHTGHHLSYGGYTPPAMMHTQILPFSTTEFRISPQTQEKLRHYARACFWQTMHNKLAPNLYLRSGAPLDFSASNICLRLAQMGSPDGKNPVDHEMAALYLTALDGNDTPMARQYRAMGIAPARIEGHFNLNLAATALHRREDWQAAAVGMLQMHRGLEIYGWTESNNYGRYSRNGTIYLTLGKETGWRRDGWNWNHWPAGTNPVRDNHDLFEGYSLYSNANNMAGGTELDGDGIWGNDFRCRDIAFKKSAYFFDNLVTVITTGITPIDAKDKQIVTTLYQQSTESGPARPRINGNTADKADLNGKTPTLLTDTLGNSYYIHPGAPVRYSRREQEWTYFNKRDLKNPQDNPCIDIRKKHFRETPLAANAKYYTPTRGAFDLAYINHGANPSGASCAYTVCIAPTPQQAAEFEQAIASTSPPVRILRQDDTAHAVLHEPTKTTGYTVFAPCTDLPAPLKSIDRPGFVIIKDLGDRYRIALATGDPEHNKEYRLEFHDGTTAAILPDHPLTVTKTIRKKQ